MESAAAGNDVSAAAKVIIVVSRGIKVLGEKRRDS